MASFEAARAHRMCTYIRRRERALEAARVAARYGHPLKQRAAHSARQHNAALVAALRFAPAQYRSLFRVLALARALQEREALRARACSCADLRRFAALTARQFHRRVLHMLHSLRAA